MHKIETFLRVISRTGKIDRRMSEHDDIYSKRSEIDFVQENMGSKIAEYLKEGQTKAGIRAFNAYSSLSKLIIRSIEKQCNEIVTK